MSLNISLTPELEDFVREKIAQGEYDSCEDVIREALSLLIRREALWKTEAKMKIEEGMASLSSGHMIAAENVWVKLEEIVSAAER